jgi:hypothetical protein
MRALGRKWRDVGSVGASFQDHVGCQVRSVSRLAICQELEFW